MNDKQNTFWFPAKRYGWGWGAPNCWQGWLVSGVFLSGIISAGVEFIPRKRPVEFAISIALLSAIFIAICYAKGEKPGWRWGDKLDDKK